MREFLFYIAIATLGLGATDAMAGTIHVGDGHSGAGYGVGGWSWNQGINTQWAANTKSVTVTTNSIGNAHVDFGHQNVANARNRVLQLRDSDCVYVAARTPGGSRWQPGCK